MLLAAQWPVGSPKLFIHTEVLLVPGQEAEVRAEDGTRLTSY